VTLATSTERVTLTIADNGAGFDTGRINTGSWGFTIMHERAAAAGIELRIESEAGRGTRVVAEARREPA
jgi:signal transduction histidine kinase